MRIWCVRDGFYYLSHDNVTRRISRTLYERLSGTNECVTKRTELSREKVEGLDAEWEQKIQKRRGDDCNLLFKNQLVRWFTRNMPDLNEPFRMTKAELCNVMSEQKQVRPEIEERNTQLALDIQRLQGEIEQQALTIIERDQQNRDCTEELKRLEESKRQLDNKIQEHYIQKNKIMAELGQEIKSEKSKSAELEQQITTLRGEIEGKSRQITQYSQEKKDYTQNLKELQQLEQKVASLTKQLSESNKKEKELNEKIKLADEKVEKEKESLKQQLEKNNIMTTQLQQQLSEKVAEIAKESAENKDCSKRLKELQKTQESYQQLQKTQEELQQELLKSQTNLTEKQKEFEQLSSETKKELESKEAQMKELQQSLNEKTKQIAGLSSKNQKFDKELKELKAVKEKLNRLEEEYKIEKRASQELKEAKQTIQEYIEPFNCKSDSFTCNDLDCQTKCDEPCKLIRTRKKHRTKKERGKRRRSACNRRKSNNKIPKAYGSKNFRR